MLALTLAPAVSKRSRRVALAGGLAVFAVANGLAALAPGYALLLAARLLASAGAAMYTPTALTQASELSAPGRRGQATAIVLSGATAAAVAGVPAGLFPAAAVGWRAAFAVIAGGSAFAGCALALLTPGRPRHQRNCLVPGDGCRIADKRRAAGDHHRPPRRGHGIEVIHLEGDDLVLAGHITDRRVRAIRLI